MVRKAIILTVILFFCGFISFISVNGTDDFYGRSQVQNITYKLPDSWRATLSEKQFEAYKEYGYSIGFKVVESGPLVRSSYHADEQARMVFNDV